MTDTLKPAISDEEIDTLAAELATRETKTQNPRRNGKIARLPKATRDIINHMLDDAIPYHVIIDELGEAGEGLNSQNLTNWFQGGYQDYLQQQDAIYRAKLLVESALDFLRELGGVNLAELRRACNYLAALQLFHAMREHGDESARRLFQQTPNKYLNVVHTLCRMSNSAIRVEKHRLEEQLLAARTSVASPQSSQIKPNQGQAKIPDNSDNPISLKPSNPTTASDSSPVKPNQAQPKIPANCDSSPGLQPI